MKHLTPEAIEQLEQLIAKIQTLKTGYEDAYKFAVRRINKCITYSFSHSSEYHQIDVQYEKQVLYKLQVSDSLSVCIAMVDWYEQSDEYKCNDVLRQAKSIINHRRAA